MSMCATLRQSLSWTYRRCSKDTIPEQTYAVCVPSHERNPQCAERVHKGPSVNKQDLSQVLWVLRIEPGFRSTDAHSKDKKSKLHNYLAFSPFLFLSVSLCFLSVCFSVFHFCVSHTDLKHEAAVKKSSRNTFSLRCFLSPQAAVPGCPVHRAGLISERLTFSSQNA